MSSSTEFFVFRGECKSEVEYENFKLSFCNVSLLVTSNLTKTICSINQNVRYLNEGFDSFEDTLYLMEKHDLEFNPNIRKQKNQIQNNYYQQEPTINDVLAELNASLQENTDAANMLEIQLKEQLRKCLEENLENYDEYTLNPLFACKNVYEIKSLFHSEEEFYSLMREKEKNFKKLEPLIAYSTLAKAVAIKVVSPMLAQDAREKKIKDNLDKIKPCISSINNSIQDFLSENTYDVSDCDELIKQMSEWKEEVYNLISTDSKRELEEKLKESKINEAAKAPPQKRKQPGLDEALTASLLRR